MKIIEAPVAQERGGAAKRRRLTMKTRVHAPALETWLPGLLAAALPRLSGALVKDQRGLCVLPGPGVPRPYASRPHPHRMEKKILTTGACLAAKGLGVAVRALE